MENIKDTFSTNTVSVYLFIYKSLASYVDTHYSANISRNYAAFHCKTIANSLILDEKDRFLEILNLEEKVVLK